MLRDFSWEIKRLLSINEMKEIGIFRFFSLFSKIWKIEEKYKANKIGDRANPYSIPMSTLKKEKEKLF